MVAVQVAIAVTGDVVLNEPKQQGGSTGVHIYEGQLAARVHRAFR